MTVVSQWPRLSVLLMPNMSRSQVVSSPPVPFMGNEDCVGIEDNGKLIFSPAHDNCEIAPRPNGTHIVYGGSVTWEQGAANAVITRRNMIEIEWECAIATQYILS